MPKVSCLMVTANRGHLVRRSVHCFLQQTYPNTELVVVDDGTEDLTPVLSAVPAGDLVYVRLEPRPETVLGHLRNVALDAASGDLLAQWDDDDWFHPDRIGKQAAVLKSGYDACTLHSTLMHIATPTYMHHPYIGYLPDGVPGTIMHRRNDSIRYPALRRAEDTVYLQHWMNHRYHMLPVESAHLFIRCFHGDNTWEREHFLTRIQNTPMDWLAYLWYRHIRRDMFGHPRFQLSEEAKAAFDSFLETSRRLDLLDQSDVPTVSI